MSTETGFDVVGKRVGKTDARMKVTGQAKYVEDIKLPGLLIGKLLRSPHPHARIVAIDTSAAEAMPGVLGVITGKDTPIMYGILPVSEDETALCIDRVRYVGDCVAAVAAVSEEVAEAALAQIRVEYEPLPAIFTAEQAMTREDLKIHEKAVRANIEREVHQEFGDVEGAFAAADCTRTDKFVNAAVTHAPIEPHGAVALYDVNGKLTLWTATQIPHKVHRTIAKCLQMPVNKVRVITPTVGGGYGAKGEIFSLEICAAVLARTTGHPVKIIHTREEVFLAHRGRQASTFEMSSAWKQDGTLLGITSVNILDKGCYGGFGIVTLLYSGAMLAGPYKVPALKWDGYTCFTNKPTCGAQRAHGVTCARWAFEVQMDMVAEALGRDPLDLRLQNAMPYRYYTVNDFNVTSCGFRECLEAVRDRSDWKNKWQKMPYGRGIGVAGSWYISGAGRATYRTDMPHSTVHVKVDVDGSVTIYTGAADIGQGSDTIQAQIVAEELGVTLDYCRVLSADTDLTPIDLGAYSSRITFMAGNAAKDAAWQIREKLVRAVAHKFALDPDTFTVAKGRVFKRDEPEVGVPYLEAVRLTTDVEGALIGKGSYTPPKLGGTYKYAGVGPSPAYSFQAQVAEVVVNPDTGKVQVEKFWAAHDCGFALNPINVEGQIEGSVSMGIGQALYEDFQFEDGYIINPSLLEYKVPLTVDSPHIESIIIESMDPAGPFGAKEAGEGPVAASIPAIANAVWDAIGVRIKRLPISPDAVLRALEEKRRLDKQRAA